MREWRNWQTRMVQVHVKAISWGFKSPPSHHDGVTKKMSLHFFQYSCGFAGFLEQKPKNRFTVDVQAAVRETIRCSGVSA